jgi:tetratricopeptide (TPR) repeat protein
VLWGFVPAMQRTWESEGGAEAAEPIQVGGAFWNSPRLAWGIGVAVLAAVFLAAALAGPSFFATQDYWPVRSFAAGAGLLALIALLMRPKQDEGAGALGWALLAVVSLGGFFFAWHSTKIWVADSFYKQGQVGMSVGQPGYAAAMYQKGAGQLRDVTQAQVESIHRPEIPAPGQGLQITPGLNPDQELYWVKMGIAFESAASSSTKPEDKLLYYRTALAIHQYTLEMNPINGYNYNNKGRVLKAMGEAFHDQGYFQAALAHYDKAIELDKHNVYFNLDKANTLLSLGRPADSLAVCQHLMDLFPGFAVPYSYAGFIKMQAGRKDEAIEYFKKAVDNEWYRDLGSKALAATNLGLLLRQKKDLKGSEAAFRAAIEANPAQQEAALNLADLLLRDRRGAEGVAVLQALLKAVPNQPQALETLKRLGVQP